MPCRCRSAGSASADTAVLNELRLDSAERALRLDIATFELSEVVDVRGGR